MTIDICAENLRQHDPDRFGATLVAAPADRPALLTLYALNLEIARAPFQSSEPMLAEMRLQWWIDRLDQMGQGTAPPLHDVLTPLWQAWGRDGGAMAALAEARRRDCARDPFGDAGAVLDYVDATAGRLMALAARRLGAPDRADGVIRDQGRGAGVAAWLRAWPQLQAMGLGLSPADATEQTAMLRAMAQAGSDALDRARAGRRLLPKRAAPALYCGARVRRALAAYAGKQSNNDQHDIEITPFQRRSSLAALAMTGRWWR